VVQGSSQAKHSSRFACGNGISGDDDFKGVGICVSVPECRVFGVAVPLSVSEGVFFAACFFRNLLRIPAGNLSMIPGRMASWLRCCWGLGAVEEGKAMLAGLVMTVVEEGC
jgi:hypothetical protein